MRQTRFVRMDHFLSKKREVKVIARTLGIPKSHALGLLYLVWEYFQQMSWDGGIDGITTEDIDDECDHEGMGAAMQAAGWLECNDHGCVLPDWHSNFSAESNKKASDAQRNYIKRLHKTDETSQEDGGDVAPPTTKRRTTPSETSRSDTASASDTASEGASDTEEEGDPATADAVDPEVVDPPKETWMTAYFDIWFRQYGGPMPCAKFSVPLRRLEKKHPRDEVIASWEVYVASVEEAQYASAQKFEQGYGQYSPTRPAGMDPVVAARRGRGDSLEEARRAALAAIEGTGT